MLILYDEKITDVSFQTIKEIIDHINFNICLCGGWEVYLTVNDHFKKQKDMNYIGSQDIDIGFSLKPMMGKTALESTNLFKMIKLLEHRGYTPSMFGYKKNIPFNHIGISRNEGEEKNFTLYIDILVNSYPQSYQDIHPQSFFEVPLIEKVYADKKYQVKLSQISNYLFMPTRDLLGAMKIKSLPSRGKQHKMVKDLCDLYSLIWFADEPPDEIISKITSILVPTSIKRLKKSINKNMMSKCEQYLSEPQGSIETVISKIN